MSTNATSEDSPYANPGSLQLPPLLEASGDYGHAKGQPGNDGRDSLFAEDDSRPMSGAGFTTEAAPIRLRSPGDSAVPPSCPPEAPSGSDQPAKCVQHFLQSLSRSEQSDSLGRVLHYEVLAVLGYGAYGIVAKAFDEKLERFVALKALRGDLPIDETIRQRFVREARLAASVTHENVVAVHAVEEEPFPFLAMQFVNGRTLFEFAEQRGSLDPDEVVRIGRELASGLAAAHARNLVHRDVKPQNILIEDGGVQSVRLADFGLARAVDDVSLTQSGMIVGSPKYMSPEQIHGTDLDARSDLFSLGSVLYFLLSGKEPFAAPTKLAVLHRIVRDAPVPLQECAPRVPEDLVKIVDRLLAKDREKRFASAGEVAMELHRVLEKLQSRAEQVVESRSAPHRAARPDRRGGLMALGLLTVVVGLGGLWNSFPPDPSRPVSGEGDSAPTAMEAAVPAPSVIDAADVVKGAGDAGGASAAADGKPSMARGLGKEGVGPLLYATGEPTQPPPLPDPDDPSIPTIELKNGERGPAGPTSTSKKY